MFNIPSIACFSVHCFSGSFCQEVETGESPPACELMVNAACCRFSPGDITLSLSRAVSLLCFVTHLFPFWTVRRMQVLAVSTWRGALWPSGMWSSTVGWLRIPLFGYFEIISPPGTIVEVWFRPDSSLVNSVDDVCEDLDISILPSVWFCFHLPCLLSELGPSFLYKCKQ